jgi:hypothetical protein
MYRKLAVAVMAAVIGSGCIRSGTLITVKPDGSGTIEQTVLMNAAALKGMLGGLGAPPQQGGGINVEELKKTAARLGEGVTYVSSEPLKDPDGFEGAKALYAFTDINKIQVDQDPNLSGSTSGVSTARKEDNPVTFAMTRTGDVSNLTVTFHDKPKAAKPDAPATAPGGPSTDNPQMTEMMKTMFKGFKVNIDLQVVGSIVKTNADYVAGNKVTLLEMDLGALLADEAKLKEVQKVLGPDASIAELKPYLKDIKGLKINDPVVTIAFK